jgi:aryl-alcohol dehydrogenase-like predicted oxidoreductase
MVSRIALGTVQFGLDYGISNTGGQVPIAEVKAILEEGRIAGVDTIDTASAYGNGEKILGRVGLANYKVVTKIPPDCSHAEQSLRNSIAELQANPYGLLYHSFTDYKSGRLSWREVQDLKEQFGIAKIGFSLYAPEEWDELIADGVRPELIQVPYNLFDRRFETVFEEAKKLGTEIHTRSTFLQGLFFRDPKTLTNHFEPVVEQLKHIRGVATKNGLDLAACLLHFALTNNSIDRVVIGVVSADQLRSNLSGIADSRNDLSRYIDLNSFRETNEEIINPSKWKTV